MLRDGTRTYGTWIWSPLGCFRAPFSGTFTICTMKGNHERNHHLCQSQLIIWRHDVLGYKQPLERQQYLNDQRCEQEPGSFSSDLGISNLHEMYRKRGKEEPTVPSNIFNNACWTPSPDTSRLMFTLSAWTMHWLSALRTILAACFEDCHSHNSHQLITD